MASEQPTAAHTTSAAAEEPSPLPVTAEAPAPAHETVPSKEAAAPAEKIEPLAVVPETSAPVEAASSEAATPKEASVEQTSAKDAQAETIPTKEAPTQAIPTTKESPLEEAPDPDEDDLSDLDDVLDEFAAINISPKPSPTSSGPGRAISAAPTAAPPPTAPVLADDDEFANSLQAGMAELLGEFESNPEMQKQFEELVKELGDGMAAATDDTEDTASSSKDIVDTTSTAKAAVDGSKTDASFQATIQQTMERMNASSAAATSASTSAGEEDFLAAMLREMEKSGPEGLGAGGDEDFSSMLLGMMEHLTNKDILYEPMKELHDKFPGWLETHAATTGKEDLERYMEQKRLVDEIVGKFEEKEYSDDKVEYREFIVERMQKVCASLVFHYSVRLGCAN